MIVNVDAVHVDPDDIDVDVDDVDDDHNSNDNYREGFALLDNTIVMLYIVDKYSIVLQFC